MTDDLRSLEGNIKLQLDKLQLLQREKILVVDPELKFNLDQRIMEAERNLQQLRKRRAELLDFHTVEGSSLLRERIEKLRLEVVMGEEQLVNCDRSQPKKRFWAAFDQAASTFQYYFISACPTQMPPSFSEALIYALIREELDENSQALFCQRHESTNRIRFHNLPAGRNLQKSQQQFRKFMARYFEWSTDTSLDAFVQRDLAQMPYDQIVICFRLSPSKWQDHFPDYFQWIIDAFNAAPKEGPAVLFFFVLSMEGIHRQKAQRQDQILRALDQLGSHIQVATHLSPLFPVPISDLKAWFSDELDEYNDGRQMAVIEVLAQGLKGEDLRQYQEEDLLNMDDIERLQELIYEVVQQKNSFFS